MPSINENQYGIPFLQDLEKAREAILNKVGSMRKEQRAFVDKSYEEALAPLKGYAHYYTGIDFNKPSQESGVPWPDFGSGRPRESMVLRMPIPSPPDRSSNVVWGRVPTPSEPNPPVMYGRNFPPGYTEKPKSPVPPTPPKESVPFPELTANYSLPSGIPIPEQPVVAAEKTPDFANMSIGDFANYALGQKAKTRQAKTSYYQALANAQRANTALMPYRTQIERARADAEIRMKNAEIRSLLMDLKKNPVASQIITNQLRKIAEAFGAVAPQQSPSDNQKRPNGAGGSF